MATCSGYHSDSYPTWLTTQWMMYKTKGVKLMLHTAARKASAHEELHAIPDLLCASFFRWRFQRDLQHRLFPRAVWQLDGQQGFPYPCAYSRTYGGSPCLLSSEWALSACTKQAFAGDNLPHDDYFLPCDLSCFLFENCGAEKTQRTTWKNHQLLASAALLQPLIASLVLWVFLNH